VREGNRNGVMKHNRGVRFIINFENFLFHISIIIKKMGDINPPLN
jgi:hypothetical protein